VDHRFHKLGTAAQSCCCFLDRRDDSGTELLLLFHILGLITGIHKLVTAAQSCCCFFIFSHSSIPICWDQYLYLLGRRHRAVAFSHSSISVCCLFYMIPHSSIPVCWQVTVLYESIPACCQVTVLYDYSTGQTGYYSNMIILLAKTGQILN
jgi:hypothetical protein